MWMVSIDRRKTESWKGILLDSDGLLVPHLHFNLLTETEVYTQKHLQSFVPELGCSPDRTILCERSIYPAVLQFCYMYNWNIVIERHFVSQWWAHTGPVGSVVACSAKGWHNTSKRLTFLTPLGFLPECWSYAFNNGFVPQGKLVRVVSQYPGFSIAGICSPAELWCCWVT